MLINNHSVTTNIQHRSYLSISAACQSIFSKKHPYHNLKHANQYSADLMHINIHSVPINIQQILYRSIFTREHDCQYSQHAYKYTPKIIPIYTHCIPINIQARPCLSILTIRLPNFSIDQTYQNSQRAYQFLVQISRIEIHSMPTNIHRQLLLNINTSHATCTNRVQIIRVEWEYLDSRYKCED